MSRNIAPWIVPTTTSWGVRRNLRTVRVATASVLVRNPGGPAGGRSSAVDETAGTDVVEVPWSVVAREVMAVLGSRGQAAGAGGRLGVVVARGVGGRGVDRLAREGQEPLVGGGAGARGVVERHAPLGGPAHRPGPFG